MPFGFGKSVESRSPGIVNKALSADGRADLLAVQTILPVISLGGGEKGRKAGKRAVTPVDLVEFTCREPEGCPQAGRG